MANGSPPADAAEAGNDDGEIGLKIGRYRLIRRLGEGGHATNKFAGGLWSASAPPGIQSSQSKSSRPAPCARPICTLGEATSGKWADDIGLRADLMNAHILLKEAEIRMGGGEAD